MLNEISRLLRKWLRVYPRIRTDDQAALEKTESCSITSAHSRRKDDLTAESQLAMYLDHYLYSDFPTKSSFSKIRRVYDKSEQLLGVDVEFTGNDGRIYRVDEKAQLYYLNKDLPTFAFELMFNLGTREIDGWLCNPSLKTDFYMLIWPFAKQDNCIGITWDMFTKADCLLVQKRKLLEFLAGEGLTIDRLQADARNIRSTGKLGKIVIPGLSGIYYYASNPCRYEEAPINIVISKTKLLKIAQRRYCVTPTGVTQE